MRVSVEYVEYTGVAPCRSWGIRAGSCWLGFVSTLSDLPSAESSGRLVFSCGGIIGIEGRELG
jgi:hypothetical protein